MIALTESSSPRFLPGEGTSEAANMHARQVLFWCTCWADEGCTTTQVLGVRECNGVCYGAAMSAPQSHVYSQGAAALLQVVPHAGHCPRINTVTQHFQFTYL